MSDDLFRLIFDNTYQFIGLLDPHGRALEVNQTALAVAGVTLDEVVGQLAWDTSWFPEEAHPTLREAVAQAAQGDFVRYEMDIVGVDAQVMTIDFSLRPVKDPAGEVTHLIAEGRDITERKKVERALQESEARFSTLFYATPVPVTLTTLNEGLFLDLNSKAEAALGFSRQEAMGRTSLELGIWAKHPEGERSRMLKRLHKQGELRDVEMTLKRESEAPRDILASFALVEVKGEPCLLSTFVDVTERNLMETQLRESEAHHRTVIDVLHEGVIQQELDGRVSMCNAAAERILGLTREQMMTRIPSASPWWTVREDGSALPTDEHPSMVALRTGTPQRGVVIGVHKPDDSLCWVMVNAQPLVRPGEDTPSAVISSFTDITSLKEAEARLRHASLHDALTGLPLRTLFAYRLEQAVAKTKRDPTSHFAVLFIDLDGFKAVNDALGHEAGDKVLRKAAHKLAACVRKGDTVARLGGDEFAVLLGDLARPEDALDLTERIVEAVIFSVGGGGAALTVSASVGVTLATGKVEPKRLMQEADAAMYQAKAAGKGCYRVFDIPE